MTTHRRRDGGRDGYGVQRLAGGQRRNSKRPRLTRWYKTSGRQIWARLTTEVRGRERHEEGERERRYGKTETVGQERNEAKG